jgi:peptidoglycan/xylan/chitin deacetylase (PgdA/CDA1 family)
MKQDKYAIVGIDMETDIGSYTPFYEGVRTGTKKLLEIVRHLSIPATFFFTGDCAKNNPGILHEVIRHGHEIGCHSLYHETLGDELYPVPGLFPLLPQEVEGRIMKATEILQELSGIRPVSFRCPRLFGSTNVVNTLEKLNYLCDASYPLYYYKERLTPYHPDPKDWTRPGEMRLLEIPNFADVIMPSSDPHGKDRDQWPLFRTKGAATLFGKISSFNSLCSKKNLPTVLCFYFHPWEFIEMPREVNVGRTRLIPDESVIMNCGKEAVEQLVLLLNMLLDDGYLFYTAKDFSIFWNGTFT